jgi:hypothetical protein
MKKRLLVSLLFTSFACAVSAFTQSAVAAKPPLSITPTDAQPVISMTATGVQIYTCEFDGSHHLAWLFKQPQATLYDSLGRPLVHHDAGPSWQAQDGSRIVGHLIAQTPSESPQSIPQLLLDTKSVDKAGELAKIRYVQRLDTVGGTAPTEQCTTEHQIGSSPYFARYVFWN